MEIREKMDLKQIGRRNGKIGGIRAESYHDLLQIKNDETPYESEVKGSVDVCCQWGGGSLL